MRHHPTIIAVLAAAVLVLGGLHLFGAGSQPGGGPREGDRGGGGSGGGMSVGGTAAAGVGEAGPTRLAIVWTSGDPEVAHRMTLMYTNAAKSRGWFDEVRLIVWGPSQRLVVADKDIRAAIERLIEAGVIVEACLACADSYGLADDLRTVEGLDVKYMGEPLTGFLKSAEWVVMTF